MRSILSATLIAGLTVAVVAQDKPKPPPRIAVNDPDKLKDDKDFAVQGEYSGEAGTSKRDARPASVQVIALGDGKFEAKLYESKLPGEDGGGTKGHVLKGEWKDGKPVFSATHDGKTTEFAFIEGGKFKSYFHLLDKVERKSATLGAKPPDGATVLFGVAGDEKNWDGGKLVELPDGKFLNVGVKSKQKFGAFTAHVEFRLPWMPNSRGQQRGNSGVYVQDRYEVQVLDSFGLNGENNECGGVYTMFKPKVNMCYPPMAWQTYDIDFTPAAFDGDKKTTNARLTVKHNGVLVQDNVELKGSCPGGQKEAAEPGPFQFQNHGDPVVYRNVWVVEKK